METYGQRSYPTRPWCLGLIRCPRGGGRLLCWRLWAIRVLSAARFEAGCVGIWRDKEMSVDCEAMWAEGEARERCVRAKVTLTCRSEASAGPHLTGGQELLDVGGRAPSRPAPVDDVPPRTRGRWPISRIFRARMCGSLPRFLILSQNHSTPPFPQHSGRRRNFAERRNLITRRSNRNWIDRDVAAN